MRGLGFVLAAVLLSGCARLVPQYAQHLDCDSLKKVIASIPQDFASVATTTVDTRYGTIWRTNTNAYGDDCSLLGSDNRVPRSYFCSIPEKDQKAAMQALADDVEKCLGPTWQRKELPRPATRFTRSSDVVAVDVGISDVQASRTSAVGLLVRKL